MSLAVTLRSLLRSPGFSLSIVLTLAIGVAPTVAVLALADGLLLRPLPFADSDRIVTLLSVNGPDSDMPGATPSFTLDKAAKWAAQRSVLDGIAYYDRERFTSPVAAGQLDAAFVSAEFFAFLGTTASLGRSLTADDVKNSSAIAVISHELWVSAYGSDRGAIGKTLQLNNRAFEVVGVMPPHFAFPSPTSSVWLPLSNSRYVNVVTRIPRGNTVQSTQAQADAVAGMLNREEPLRGGWGIRLRPVTGNRVSSSAARLLSILGGAALCILLVAGSNAASLYSSRMSGRRTEFGVRAALGASRWQMVKLVASEGVLLASAASFLALLVGHQLFVALQAYLPSGVVAFDIRAVTLGLSVAMFTGALVMSVVSVRTGRSQAGLADLVVARSTRSRRDTRLTKAILGAQVALTVVLLMAASSFIVSVVKMSKANVGVDTAPLVSTALQLPAGRYATGEARALAWKALLERLLAVPGVVAVSHADSLPPANGTVSSVRLNGSNAADLTVSDIDSAFLDVLGVPVVRGRVIDGNELGQAVVDELAASQLWPGADAIGQRIEVGVNRRPLQVVGVVEHVQRGRFAEDEPRGQVYMLSDDRTIGATRGIVLRTVDPSDGSTLDNVRQTVEVFDPTIVVSAVSRMSSDFAELTDVSRGLAVLVALLSTGALLMASIGMFGLLSQSVAHRLPELGIRMALGAVPGRLVADVVVDLMWPVIGGAAMGMAFWLPLGRFVEANAFDVSAKDPVVALVVLMLIVATAAIAALVPTRRALRLAPSAVAR